MVVLFNYTMLPFPAPPQPLNDAIMESDNTYSEADKTSTEREKTSTEREKTSTEREKTSAVSAKKGRRGKL